MATVINTINEIVKWAKELPDWQSDALRRLFVSGDLTKEDVLEVINIAKQTSGFKLSTTPPKAIPFIASHAPGQSSSSEIIYLRKIRDVKYVNALASGQTISLGGKGITVIYGDNGSGKSGYSRLLKRACRARHTEEILPNIHESPAHQGIPEAVFDIIAGDTGNSEPLTWKEGDITPDELSQISVFDTHCARIFVDEANTVSYIPYGLDVFPKFAHLFDELKSQLTNERTQLERRDEILQEMTGEHEVGIIIAALSAKTDITRIEKLSTLSEKEEKEFRELDAAIKELKANDPEKQAVAIRRTKTRVEQQRGIFKNYFNVLGNVTIQKLQGSWETAKTKADAAKLASSEQFSKEPLSGVGSDAWMEMYKHAKEYSVKEAYPGKIFPVIDDSSNCPLCMQNLSPDAKDRLKRFEAYVSDKTEKEASDAKISFMALFKPIKELRIVEVEQSLVAEILEISNEAGGMLANVITAITQAKESIISAVKRGEWESVKKLDITIVQKLKIIIDSLESDAKKKDQLVEPEKQKQMVKKHAELAARIKLMQHKATVLEHVKRFVEADCLTKIIDSLNSRAVSTKASQLSQLVLTSELKSSIDSEFSRLRINHINLGLKPSSPKGTTKHQLTITDSKNSSKLTKILSEGEQRVIAIASFLGELALSPIKSGIVFDDPVSSLDHKWTERIAKRLVSEGIDRQVIIFTHNISFLLSLYKHASKEQVKISSQSLYRVLNSTGQCDDDLPWSARNAEKRTEILTNIALEARVLYKTDPDGCGYRDLHDKFYSRLRSTWERTVEEILLNNVVLRFDSGVSTQLLNGVDVDDEDFRDVYNAMSRSSEGIDAHDHAAGQHDQVNTPDEMDHDLAKLKAFKKRIGKKKDETIKRRKESIKAPTHQV